MEVMIVSLFYDWAQVKPLKTSSAGLIFLLNVAILKQQRKRYFWEKKTAVLSEWNYSNTNARPGIFISIWGIFDAGVSIGTSLIISDHNGG